MEDAGHIVIVDDEDGETFDLALEEATAQDSGTYKCVATNAAGSVTCTATLTVEGESSKVTKKDPVSKPTEDMIGKSIELLVQGKKVM